MLNSRFLSFRDCFHKVVTFSQFSSQNFNARLLSCGPKLVRQDSVKNILQDEPNPATAIRVDGWARRVQKQKLTCFVHLDDGSTSRRLQIVVPNHLLDSKKLTNGQALSCRGTLVKSAGHQQSVELLCDSIDIVGDCDPKTYEIGHMKDFNADYLRERIHLRPRVRFFQSMLRVRSEAMTALQLYMSQNAFVQVNTPMVTANDCEGGGECFTLHTTRVDSNKEYFGRKSFLTVSGQLHLEAMAASLAKVWTLGPVFRAEKSMSPKHLAEFLMLEVEESFLTKLNPLLDRVESLIKFLVFFIEQRCQDDLRFVREQNQHSLDLSERFKRITYDDAIELLEQNPEFDNSQPITHLNSKMEQKIVELLGNVPVFVTHYPFEQKPFYMKSHDNRALCFDLLMPLVGEVAGGSLREDSLERLEQNILDKMPDANHDQLEWYLDLRRFGHAPSGGFGVGFDRLIQVLTGTPNIKDVVPFPRWPYHCYLEYYRGLGTSVDNNVALEETQR